MTNQEIELTEEESALKIKIMELKKAERAKIAAYYVEIERIGGIASRAKVGVGGSGIQH